MATVAQVGRARARGAKAGVEWKGAMLPPGPSWPSVAQLGGWLYFPLPFLRRLKREYGSPFTLRFPAGPPIISFDDPAVTREVFTGPYKELYAGKANEPLRPIVGANSLLLLDGDRHRRERKLLIPPFHGQRMIRYGEVMRDVTAAVLPTLPLNRAFAVQPHTQSITLDIILRTVFGAEEGPSIDRLRSALSSLINDFSSPSLIVPFMQRDLGPRSPWGRYRRTRERCYETLFAHIEERRRDPTERDDVLAMLLSARYEDGEPMSREELRDELITLLVAGHETTATALSWAFHHLATYPDVQRRVHAELDEVFTDGAVDPEASSGLVYLDAVIKETLRLHPVIAAVGRVLEKPRTIGGWDLPKGVMVVPSIYLTHHNPEVYPQPRRFDPMRFLDGKPSPYEFLPFGGGMRRCIGAAFALYEMRMVLATVLTKHRVRPAPGVVIKPKRRSVTIGPSDDMPVVLELR